MATNTLLDGNVHINGGLTAKTLTLPASTVLDAGVASGANVAANKLEHLHLPNVSQDQLVAATSQRFGIHLVRGADGSISEFKARLTTACVGDSTITVDLYKNGSSILSAPISFSSADSANVDKNGTLSSSALAQGDFLAVNIVATVGTGTLGKGTFAQAKVYEKAQ